MRTSALLTAGLATALLLATAGAVQAVAEETLAPGSADLEASAIAWPQHLCRIVIAQWICNLANAVCKLAIAAWICNTVAFAPIIN